MPPNVHRRNAAERAIRTFKNHFIAGLCSVDEHFPIHLWDRLLPQALITLNLMRSSRIHPRKSAWAQYSGQFDFNRTPIAPPGIRVLVHEKPGVRTTWSPHALDGCYTGPALESYRCYTVWMFDTRSERICDTVTWFLTKVTMPIAHSNDLILARILDIANALKSPSTGSPLAPQADSHVAKLNEIINLLTNACSTADIDNNANMSSQEAEHTTVAPLLRVIDTYANGTSATNKLDIQPVEQTKHVQAKQPAIAPPVRVAATPINDPTTDDIASMRVPATACTGVIASDTHIEAKAPDATYSQLTGPIGKKTRRNRRRTEKGKALDATRKCKSNTGSTVQHHALHGNAINSDTGKIAEYAELLRCSEGPKWECSGTDEYGRLFQGHATMPHGTDTRFFIPKSSVPKGTIPTYMRIVAAQRPEKEVKERIRATIGGDRIEYTGDTSTKGADLATVKIHINNVISESNAKYCCADLKDFYLNTPLKREDYAYMKVPISVIPKTIMDHYNVWDMVEKGFVYVEVRKGMYGLKQAGRLANDQVTVYLAKYGYRPVPITPGLWKHDTRNLSFTLVVDDFGIKYTDEQDLEHLLSALRAHYTISFDKTGSKYCGMTLEWDYTTRTCVRHLHAWIHRTSSSTLPTPYTSEETRFPACMGTIGIRSQNAAHTSTRRFADTRRRRHQTSTGSARHTIVLRTSSRLNNVNSNRNPRITAS